MDNNSSFNNVTMADFRDERLSEMGYQLVGALLVIISLSAVGGNALVLVLVWRFKALRTNTNFLITNLAVADLGVSILGFPMSAVASFANKWMVGAVGCHWYGFSGMLFGLANIFLLTVISVDRYVLTCKHTTFLRMTIRHYVFLATFAWVSSGIWAAIPLTGACSYSLDPSGMMCVVTWLKKSPCYTPFILSVFVFCFVVPTIVITFCYVNTWRFIRSVGDGGQQENIEWTHEKQVAKMCAVAISLFLMAWTPYAATCLWAALGRPETIPAYMTVIPPLFAKASSCFNPVVYAFLNKRFRLALRKMLGLTQGPREEEAVRLHHLVS